MANPTVSVFTPSHDPRWLDECYASLEAQTFTNWEWIVLLNGGVTWSHPGDRRVRTCIFQPDISGVGRLKREACTAARGEYLVELDHDDVLTVDALDEIVKAFRAHPEVGLVYSDCAQMNEDGSVNDDFFAEGHGWTYRTEGVKWLHEKPLPRVIYNVIESKPPTPHNVSYIWYAPNHVRAFRRSVYEEVGGHNPDLDICDDADLICRMYQAAPFVHIPELLYLQRMHDGNTQRDPEQNARIQAETVRLYDEHVQANALVWARREGVEALDLGGAHGCPEGYLPIDIALTPELDVFAILATYLDETVGVIRAVDFLEHIADPVALMNEIHRVLAPGGMLLSLTPSTDGRGAFCDPTHISFFNELSFRYYTDDEYRKYVPAITAKFRQSRLVTYFPSDWHRENNVPYVCSNLVKEG